MPDAGPSGRCRHSSCSRRRSCRPATAGSRRRGLRTASSTSLRNPFASDERAAFLVDAAVDHAAEVLGEVAEEERMTSPIVRSTSILMRAGTDQSVFGGLCRRLDRRGLGSDERSQESENEHDVRKARKRHGGGSVTPSRVERRRPASRLSNETIEMAADRARARSYRGKCVHRRRCGVTGAPLARRHAGRARPWRSPGEWRLRHDQPTLRVRRLANRISCSRRTSRASRTHAARPICSACSSS